MNLELDQQDPNDPNRMWGPDVISPIFPLKGHERPVEEVRADLKKHLVGQQIKMWHDLEMFIMSRYEENFWSGMPKLCLLWLK